MYWPHPGGIVPKTNIETGGKDKSYKVPDKQYMEFTNLYAADLQPAQTMILALEEAAKKTAAVATAAVTADAVVNSTSRSTRLGLGPAAALVNTAANNSMAVVSSSIKSGKPLEAQVLAGYIDPMDMEYMTVYSVEVSSLLKSPQGR
jgi:hypothetical protein